MAMIGPTEAEMEAMNKRRLETAERKRQLTEEQRQELTRKEMLYGQWRFEQQQKELEEYGALGRRGRPESTWNYPTEAQQAVEAVRAVADRQKSESTKIFEATKPGGIEEQREILGAVMAPTAGTTPQVIGDGGGGARQDTVWQRLKSKFTRAIEDVVERIPPTVTEVAGEAIKMHILKVDEDVKIELEDIPTEEKEYVPIEKRIKEIEVSGLEGTPLFTEYYDEGKITRIVEERPILKETTIGFGEIPTKEVTREIEVTELTPGGPPPKKFIETRVSLTGPPGWVVMREAEISGEDPGEALKIHVEEDVKKWGEGLKIGTEELKAELKRQLIIIPARAAGEFTIGFVGAAPEAIGAGAVLGITEKGLKLIGDVGGAPGKVAVTTVRLGQIALISGGISTISTAWKESDFFGKARIAGGLTAGAYFTPKAFEVTTTLMEAVDLSKIAQRRAQRELQLIKETMETGDTIIKTEGKISQEEILRQTEIWERQRVGDLLEIDKPPGLYEQPSGGKITTIQEVPITISKIKIFGKQIVQVVIDIKTGETIAFVSKGPTKGTAYLFAQAGEQIAVTGFRVKVTPGTAPKVKPFYTGKFTGTPVALTLTGRPQEPTTFADVKEPTLVFKEREAQIGKIIFGKGEVEFGGFELETGVRPAIKETYLKSVQTASDRIALAQKVYGRGPTLDITQFVPVEYKVGVGEAPLPTVTKWDVTKWQTGEAIGPVVKETGKIVTAVGEGIVSFISDETTGAPVVAVQKEVTVTPTIQIPSVAPSVEATQAIVGFGVTPAPPGVSEATVGLTLSTITPSIEIKPTEKTKEFQITKQALKTEMISEAKAIMEMPAKITIPTVKTTTAQITRHEMARAVTPATKQRLITGLVVVPVQVTKPTTTQITRQFEIPQPKIDFGPKVGSPYPGIGIPIVTPKPPKVPPKKKKAVKKKKRKKRVSKFRGLLVVPSPTVQVPVRPLKFQTPAARRAFIKAGLKEGAFLQFKPPKGLSISKKKKKRRRKK